MTHESQKTPQEEPLTDEALDQVAGGGDALDAIRSAVNDASKGGTNTMTDPYLTPPSMTCPSSLPYDPI